jgi:L-alanine-DL-glutamate epimerase-like enolase superfamily enzyme
MKITDIKVHLFKKQLSSTMQISRIGFQVRSHAIVEVITDEGISGLGEGVGDADLVKAIIECKLRGLALGLNPFNIETIRTKLIDSEVYMERKGSVICAASAIEMACWDIKGKALNVPVYQLLGGLYREKIETYASDVYWEEDASKMADNCLRIKSLGFKTIKAHLGCASPKDELSRIEAIRNAIGPEVKLMIDLNGGYDLMEARQAIKLWEPYDLFWLEEPLNPNYVSALSDLRHNCPIPIAAGENEFRVEGFKQLFDLNAVDVPMPDLGRVGGMQETKNLCAIADTYGLIVSPHNFSSGVLLSATIHIMASTPNARFLEIDTSNNAVYYEFFRNAPIISDGFLKVPHLPGLGIELGKDLLDKYVTT